MRNQDWRRALYLLFFIAAISLAGCKKNVAAAAPPAAPPVQPAPPPPAPAPTVTLRAAPNTIDRGQAAAPSRPEPPRADVRASMDELFRQNVQTIYFDFDKSDIRSDQVSRLEANASWLKEHRGLKFRIEGNCDEQGSEEYNLGLGDRRANRVKDFLIKEGVDPSRISTISYGEERPICRQKTEECYQRNRRAGFALSPLS